MAPTEEEVIDLTVASAEVAKQASENTPTTTEATKGGKKGDKKMIAEETKESKALKQVKSLTLEMKTMGKEMASTQRNHDVQTREKEKLSLELLRANKQREKLEELCRELQKQNKMIQEDSKLKTEEEQKRREELSTRFQDAVGEINTRLTTQSEEQGKQLQENDNLRNKLMEFSEKVEAREEMYNNQMQAKGLECQLFEKRLEQEVNRTAEATLKMEAFAEQATFLMKTEAELRSQLGSYREKFESFQDMLTSSHEAFTTFKTDMDKMGKEIRKLKKENDMLRGKTMASDTAIIEAVEVKAVLNKKVELVQLKNQRLETLCRTLQAQLKAKAADDSSANVESANSEDSAAVPNID